ncbi:MAG: hypothetical protein IT162_00970 [Bryobacterales bacterium]|nr:hypothetical protein [Bryobacterales bacterium]
MSELTMWMAESAARAAVLAGVAAALLVLLRVRDAALRSAVWNAVTVASLLMPLAVYFMPPVFLREAAPIAPFAFTAAPRMVFTSLPAATPPPSTIDWLAALYLAGLATGIAHLGAGLLAALRLRRRATPTELPGVYETREIGVPVTTGWLRPAVLLPASWREWEPRKREAVLLHERAHIARADCFFHTLGALHRAVYWFSPLAWWMQRNNAALAEQASDDRALAQVEDRALYAEVLFSFVNQPLLAPPAPAVAMARSGAAVGERIDLVLDESRPLARPVRRGWLASILITSGLALYAASAISLAQAPPPPPPPPPPAPAAHPAPPVPPVPPGPPAPGRRRTYSTDGSEIIEVRDDRIYYERNGERYLITDPQVLKAVQQLHQPMTELGRRQAELGERQAEMGRKQAEVAVDTSGLNAKLAAQMEVIRASAAKKQMTQAELGELQRRIGEMQHALSELQHSAGRSQHELGRQQHELGRQQHELGRRQHDEAERARQAERSLIDQAIRGGKAKRVE